MQLDCVAAESAPPKALSSIHCARYDFSPPLINFPLSLSIIFPCTLPFFFLPRSLLCPNLCVVLPSLCSPPLSPSFCLVFSWAVCWTCCWKELCTIGQEGMKKKFPGRRVHKATMHRKPPASKTVMPHETNQQR